MANYQLTHTGAEVDDAVSIALNIYRVGSIYMSVDPTDPSTLFGGTWDRIKDRFLLSAGDNYAAESTGGEAAHTLTVNEMPVHNHNFNDALFWSGSDGGWASIRNGTSTSAGKANLNTAYAGGGAAHNNMPPYLAVYMWVRTA